MVHVMEASPEAWVERMARSSVLPHRPVETFNLSNDLNFEAKLVDVVGLYLDPRGTV